jgi:hypothetical protein
MNRHAEKTFKNDPNEESFDGALGGIVASIYSCPDCGSVEAVAQGPGE